MKKIVLAIDSFKGCLSSYDVEQAAKEGVQSVLPDSDVLCVPIADGGEGMLDVMVQLTQGHYVEVAVHDPLMRPIKAKYGVTGDGTTAIIEMAQASGLPLLSEYERNPMETTSYGTGELIAHALVAGYRKILIGIGGSATNDAGMGMMQALGTVFYDDKGQKLSTGCGKLLPFVRSVDIQEFNRLISLCSFATACDVDNPFCGSNGAAYVFARQKGANSTGISLLDEGMRSFAGMVYSITGLKLNELPGAGAAGGIGGALAAFFHSSLRPGIDLILEKVGFESKIQGADLIITGEGKADEQTMMGKVPAGVLKYGLSHHIPVVLMAGTVDNSEFLLKSGFTGVYAATPSDMPLAEALRKEIAKANISRSAVQIIKESLVKGQRTI